MGESGHLVRSIFEQDPTHIPDTYRGKDPIAHRAQELRQPAGQYSGGEDGMLQQFPNPAGSQNPNPHRSHQLGGHRNTSCANNGPQPPWSQSATSAETAGSGANQQWMQQWGRTMGGPFPGATHPQHQGPHHRRPHSVAFAELQARREQRLLGAIGAPFRFPREPSDSDPSPSSGSSDSDAGADSNIPRGRSQPGIWAGPGFGEGRLLEAAAWVPDNADIDALVAAAGREAVHHTGLGPLYQAALGLLGADSLRNGARELQDRLGRYRLRMDAWQRRQQHLCQVQDLKNNSSGNSGDDSSSGSSGAEEGKMRRLRMRPYLRLGPTELLLLSIHPSVAVKESSGCKTATGLGVSMAIGSTLSNAVSDPICSGAKSSRQRDVATGAVHAPGRTALGNSPLRVPRSEVGRQERGRQQQNEKRKFQQGKKWQQIANALGSGDGGIAGSGPSWPQPQQSAATAAVTSAAPSLSPSPLRHLYLEVPFKPYGREAAAYATAMGVLLAALRRAEGSCLEAFGFRFSREEYLEVLAQGGPARVGPLEGLWQLVPPLVQLLQARPGLLAEMRLSCPPGLLDAEQVECLQRATVDRQIGNQRRLAVLMGTHRRLDWCLG
ncbi:hypothetical protein Vretimale_15587 [Volvox reticuliferus]|uniref:Uncharacterized protein n=1 Tax=Volvox reticuliferus TaxID=1737510 RepID=A0A8J4CNM3_9CHLO|nr:hypothetical protein Vretifemale_15040 [Volvox reticuliferus]GIM12189.1 hypothetical protein Vretimale_15587 [Volvox reticuliferus]